MPDSGNANDDVFPQSRDGGPGSGNDATPGRSGAQERGGTDCEATVGSPEIELILRGLDRLFMQECIKRLEPREKEGNPHE